MSFVERHGCLLLDWIGLQHTILGNVQIFFLCVVYFCSIIMLEYHLHYVPMVNKQQHQISSFDGVVMV